MRPASLAFLSLIAAAPVYAQVQEPAKPPLIWKTTAKVWQLQTGSGPAIPCTKSGSWPELSDSQIKPNGTKRETVFRCGSVVLTRLPSSISVPGITGGWTMRDRAGQTFGLYAIRELTWTREGEGNQTRQILSTTLKGGWGGLVVLSEVSTGKLVPMPQPVFR